MNESNDVPDGLPRRDVLKGAAAVGLGLSVFANHPANADEAATKSGADLIRKENAKPGTRDWMLTKTDITDNEPVELWRSPRIEGYCSETSVHAGDTLKIMVSTNPVSEFSLEIFRTGYSTGLMLKNHMEAKGNQRFHWYGRGFGFYRTNPAEWDRTVADEFQTFLDSADDKPIVM
jgi:hypothetical protein